jgi:predicted RNA-binding Zn-ribbon protein involved in translation (DUF1610 family)
MAFVLMPTGELERKRVCPDCAAVVAVRIVPCTNLHAIAQCDECTAPARHCDAHRQRPPVLEVIKRKLVAFRTYAGMTEIGDTPSSVDRVAGKVEALDQAIGLIDAVMQGRPL